MNRITVSGLLDIQCEQKRSHVIDVEGQIEVFQKKKEIESCLNVKKFKKPCRSCRSLFIFVFFLSIRQDSLWEAQKFWKGSVH